MKTDIHFFLLNIAYFFSKWERFQTKFVEKIKTHFVWSKFFFENRAFCEIIVIIIIIIYLLTAIGLSPCGSTYLHTNNTPNDTNKNRTNQITNNVEECGPCPVFGSFYPGICLTTEKKARKNHSQGKRNFSQVNRNLSQIMWKTFVERGRLHLTIRLMRVTFCVTKTTNTHTHNM
jgi:hypothetical protein